MTSRISKQTAQKTAASGFPNKVSPPAIAAPGPLGKRKAAADGSFPTPAEVSSAEKENQDSGRQTPTFNPLSFSAEPPAQKQKVASHIEAAPQKATRLEEAVVEDATQRKTRISPPIAAAATVAATSTVAASSSPAAPLAEDLSKWNATAQSYRNTISTLYESVRGEIDHNASMESQLQEALAAIDTWRTRTEDGINNAKQLSIMQACLIAERDGAAAASATTTTAADADADLPAWYSKLASFVTPASSTAASLSFASSSSSSSAAAAAAASATPAPLSFPALPLELMIAPESSTPTSITNARQWNELSHAFRVEIAALESYIMAGRNFNETKQASLIAAQTEAAQWQERAMDVANRNAQMNIMYKCIQVEVEQNAAAAAASKAKKIAAKAKKQ